MLLMMMMRSVDADDDDAIWFRFWQSTMAIAFIKLLFFIMMMMMMMQKYVYQKWKSHFHIAEHIDNNILPWAALLRGTIKRYAYISWTIARTIPIFTAQPFLSTMMIQRIQVLRNHHSAAINIQLQSSFIITITFLVSCKVLITYYWSWHFRF